MCKTLGPYEKSGSRASTLIYLFLDLKEQMQLPTSVTIVLVQRFPWLIKRRQTNYAKAIKMASGKRTLKKSET